MPVVARLISGWVFRVRESDVPMSYLESTWEDELDFGEEPEDVDGESSA